MTFEQYIGQTIFTSLLLIVFVGVISLVLIRLTRGKVTKKRVILSYIMPY